MTTEKQLKVFALIHDANRNTISPCVKYLDSENTLKSMYKILNCALVTCTEIEVAGKLFDVWSDDEALLKDNPIPNLYVNDDLIIFGNVLFAKSGKNGETLGLNHYEIQLLWKFAQNQFPKMQEYFGRL
ncbi:MAG: hypothetical protein IK062_10370 [Selenomonadaceae bacterium]|nr:hypothetical protein [Selenomonadaceae bacterium]